MLIGVVAGLVAVLDYIGVVSFPVAVVGVSGFYIGTAFNTAFAVWFGPAALLAIYLGNLIGSLFTGTFTVFAILLAWGNAIGSAIPMLAFRLTRANPALSDAKSLAVYWLAAAAQSIASAAWVLGGYVLFGLMPIEALPAASSGWIIGGILVSTAVGIPLLRVATPVVVRLFGTSLPGSGVRTRAASGAARE